MADQISVGLEVAGLMPESDNLGAGSSLLQIPQKLEYIHHVPNSAHFDNGEGRNDEAKVLQNETLVNIQSVEERPQKPQVSRGMLMLGRTEQSPDLSSFTTVGSNQDAVEQKFPEMSQVEVTYAWRLLSANLLLIYTEERRRCPTHVTRLLHKPKA